MIRTERTAMSSRDSLPFEFRPLPLLRNPHVQTVLGNLWQGPIPAFPSRARKLLLPDGDCLVLHDSLPTGWRPGIPTALLVHGLGGSHRSGYMLRMTARLWARGLRVVRVDLRG